MKRTDVKILNEKYSELDGSLVKVAGWVKSVRNSKDFGFCTLTDGTCFKPVQIIFDNTLKNYEEIAKLNAGSTVIVQGTLKCTPENKQPYEIVATDVQIFCATDNEYPLQKKYHSVEYLRNIAYLRPRSNLFQAVFRIRSVAAMAIHKYFQQNGYVYVNTPLITTADCEGSDQMFKVTTLDLNNIPKNKDGSADMSQDLFGKTAYITGSGQLHGEAFALAFNKIYTFGPTFRTENSNTKYHANEFWMIEPEMAFYEIEDNMDLAEEFIKYCISFALEKAKDDIEFLSQMYDPELVERLRFVVNNKFVRLTYTEGVKILEESGHKFDFPVYWGADLQSEHERYLVEQHFKRPVILTDYPKEIKAFYMRLNDDGRTVAAMDVLVPGIGELIGGSQREERLDVLLARLDELGLKREDYDWYLDLRRFGSVKHAGYGLGFERLIMYLTGVSNIRDVLPFPRTTGSADF